MTNPINLDEAIKERFLRLPKVVQDAITSSDVEGKLRSLAGTNKLHLDQWDKLENEVTLALLGIQRVEDLEQNLVNHVGVPSGEAHPLAININAIVFEPIRQELERSLEHPGATGENPAETTQAQTLATARAEDAQSASTPAAIQPATPPAPTPDVKITRPSDSTAYKPGEASATRKSVGDDPYRESVA